MALTCWVRPRGQFPATMAAWGHFQTSFPVVLRGPPSNIPSKLSRTQTVEAARAEAERVRLTGAAEARAIEAVGRAEAEKMRMKASAYKQYGDAAVMALVLEALPQVTLPARLPPKLHPLRRDSVVLRSHPTPHFIYHRTANFRAKLFSCFRFSRAVTLDIPP